MKIHDAWRQGTAALVVSVSVLSAFESASAQTLVRVIEDEGLRDPVAITTWPGNTDLYVVADAVNARVTIHDKSQPSVSGMPPTVGLMVDLQGIARQRESLDNAGISGIAFHPEFLTNSARRFFYVRFNAITPMNQTVIRRWYIRPGQTFVNPASVRDICFIDTLGDVHVGGNIVIHKASPASPATMYFGVGDGFTAPAACSNHIRVQDINDLAFGKMLSLDVDAFSGQPLVPQVIALGVRNPFWVNLDLGDSLGQGKGDLWISDTNPPGPITGQNTGSYLRLPTAQSGVANFGWPWQTGDPRVLEPGVSILTPAPCNAALFGEGEPTPPPAYTNPARVISHATLFPGGGVLAFPSGSLVYRGGLFSSPLFPNYQGRLIHAIAATSSTPLNQPQIILVDAQAPTNGPAEGFSVDISNTVGIGSIMPGGHRLTTFTQDEEGEILLGSHREGPLSQGIVYRLIP